MLPASSYIKVCQKVYTRIDNCGFCTSKCTSSGNNKRPGWCITFVLQQGLIWMKDQVSETRFCKSSTALVRKAATVCQSLGGWRGHRGTKWILPPKKMLKQRCRVMDDTQSKVSLDKKSSLKKGREMKSFCSNICQFHDAFNSTLFGWPLITGATIYMSPGICC